VNNKKSTILEQPSEDEEDKDPEFDDDQPDDTVNE
jgi:hypothetical protein